MQLNVSLDIVTQVTVEINVLYLFISVLAVA